MLPQVYQEMFKMRMQMTFCGKSLLEEFSPSYTFPNDKILDQSKLKEFAGNNFKFDKDDVKFSKKKKKKGGGGRKHRGKGEIARYEHFLLFPQYFQKTCTANT